MHDKNTEKYLKSFKNYFNGQSKQSFHTVRESAINAFNRMGFPTTRKEEWRFTNTAELAKTEFMPAKNDVLNKVTKGQLNPFLIEDWKGTVLVFIDGHFAKELSDSKQNSANVKIENLINYFQKNEAFDEKFTSLASFEDEPFTALNTAFTTDGTVIEIAQNGVVEEGIHILHISTGNSFLSNQRNFIMVHKGAKATVVETYHSLKDENAFVNSVTEVFVAENVNLNHYKFQDESEKSFHISNTAVYQKSNSNYTSICFDFGGKLVRNNISTTLDGQGITSTLNGLYMAHNTQHIDNHTFIDHAQPNCESHELYRGILNNKSRGVFSGKILVRQDAQKTDAKQSNNALLLSDEAKVDAKPQLEIYADDVKCTHGATVGQLDELAIGYLRSRGIPLKKAVQMLTYAFAEEIIITIDDQAFRQKVENRLLQSLNK